MQSPRECNNASGQLSRVLYAFASINDDVCAAVSLFLVRYPFDLSRHMDAPVLEPVPVSQTYQKLYDILSRVPSVERWSAATIVELLMIEIMKAWVEKLCHATGWRMLMPLASSMKLDALSFSLGVCASSSAAQQFERSESNVSTHSSDFPHPLMWESLESGMVWHEAVSMIRRSWLGRTDHDAGSTRALALSQECTTETDLHLLSIWCTHCRCFLKLLSVIFLRMYQPQTHRIYMLLHCVMAPVLHHNQQWICLALKAGVSCILLSEELLEREPFFFSATDSSVHGSGAINPASMVFSAHDASDASKERLASKRASLSTSVHPAQLESDIMGRDGTSLTGGSICSLAPVLVLLETCGMTATLLELSRHMDSVCSQKGEQVARDKLGSLVDGAKESSLLLADAPSLASIDVKGALRGVRDAYIHLRAALALITTDSTHRVAHDSPWVRARLDSGSSSFCRGFCGEPSVGGVLGVWGTSLWIQMCKKTHPSTSERLATSMCSSSCRGDSHHVVSVNDSFTDLGVARDLDQVTDRFSYHIDTSSQSLSQTARSQKDNAVNERWTWLSRMRDLAQDEEEISLARHFGSSHGDGLPILLFLASRQGMVSRDLLKCFSRGVFDDLVHTLQGDFSETSLSAATSASRPYRAVAAFNSCMLPKEVLERCVFFLDATVTPAEGVVADRTLDFLLLDEFRRQQKPAGAILAAVAVQRAVQNFFAQREPSVVMTLALMLHPQLTKTASTQPDTHTPMRVDTVLNLASLLASGDAFVQRYCELFVYRYMSANRRFHFVDEPETARRMTLQFGPAAAHPVTALVRDAQQSMNDQHVICRVEHVANPPETRRPYGNPWRGALTVIPLTHDELLSVVGSKLLHSIRMLCHAWWSEYTSILVRADEIQQFYESERWLDEAVVDAVVRVEWLYGGGHGSCIGYGRYTQTSAFPVGSELEPSATLPNRSRSSVVVGISSAITNAVQQGSSFYDNLRQSNPLRGGHLRSFSDITSGGGSFGNDDVDDGDADYHGAYGGLLGSEASPPASQSGWESYAASLEDSSMSGEPTLLRKCSSRHTLQSVHATGKRRLMWALCCGQLTTKILPRLRKVSVDSMRESLPEVEVTGPPVVLLLLQAVERYGDSHVTVGESVALSSPDACTLDFLCSRLPVTVTKPLVGNILRTLLQAGVVKRVSHPGSTVKTYRLSSTLSMVTHRKIIITPPASLHKWLETSPRQEGASPSADKPSVVAPALPDGECGQLQMNGTCRTTLEQDDSCMRQIEVSVVRLLKVKGRLGFRELQNRVAETLAGACVLTAPAFKKVVNRLVEREFICRADAHTLEYVV